MAARGLYTAINGSWRQADARTGVRLLYRLKERERWTLLDKDRAIVVHPDGRVEEMASKADTVELDNTNKPALADPFAPLPCVRHRGNSEAGAAFGPPMTKAGH